MDNEDIIGNIIQNLSIYRIQVYEQFFKKGEMILDNI